MSDDEREIMVQYRDNKLTYLLKNLYKEYTKVNIIYHIGSNDYVTSLESCLKTLEASEKVKCNNIGGNLGSLSARKRRGTIGFNENDLSGDPDDSEFSFDKLIQHLNKENFELRNQIDTLKRSHKIKLEEL